MDKLIKVSEQTLWQVLGKFFTSFSTLIVLGMIARSYGEVGTGVYTLALTYLAFFYLAVDLGLNAYILPQLAREEKGVNNLFSLRIFLSLLLILTANILVYFLPFKNQAFNLSVLIGSLTIICSGIFNSANLVFQKKLRYDRSIIASSIGTLSIIPVIFFLSNRGVSEGLLIIGPLIGWIITALMSLILLNGFYRIRLPDLNLSYWKKFLAAWPISLTLLLNVVYFRLDAFLITKFFSFSEAGVYNLSYQVFQSVLVLPTFIMNSFYPIMVKSLAESKFNFFKQIKISSLLMLAISATATLLVFPLSPIVIRIIAGKEGFLGSVGSLQILSLSFPAYFLSSILMWSLVTLKKYKTILLIYLAGLLVNLCLNLYFIPKYSFMASSYITGISEYLILILQVVILWKELRYL